jgi:hypothetical protein
MSDCDFDDPRLPPFYQPEPRCNQCGKPRAWLEQNGCPESFRLNDGTRVGCGRKAMTVIQRPPNHCVCGDPKPDRGVACLKCAEINVRTIWY